MQYKIDDDICLIVTSEGVSDHRAYARLKSLWEVRINIIKKAVVSLALNLNFLIWKSDFLWRKECSAATNNNFDVE